MVEIKQLTKKYGQKAAIEDVSFKIEKGSIVGFLGPNGAGKSTTMNIIAGYLSASSGKVFIDGADTLEEPMQTKKMIGYLPEVPPLYLDMTVREYLSFMYELKKVRLPQKEHIDEICSLTKIKDVYTRLIGNLSKGYRQRVGIAQALLGAPSVLILDEPTVGLDPKQIIEIRNLIKSLGKKHTVILSSHVLSEVQAVCERIIVINDGKIVADGKTDSLVHNLSKEHKFTARIEAPEKELVKAVKSLEKVQKVYSMGEKEKGIFEIQIESKPDTDVRRDLFNLVVKKGWVMFALSNSDLTLEDLFLKLTSGEYLSDKSEKNDIKSEGKAEGDKVK